MVMVMPDGVEIVLVVVCPVVVWVTVAPWLETDDAVPGITV